MSAFFMSLGRGTVMKQNQTKEITGQFAGYVSQNILGMLGISCYIIVDTFFISKVAGSNGITVLNLVLPVFNLIFAIGSMIGVGSAICFALLRARKDERAEKYFANAVCWVCIISLLFVAAGIWAPDVILKIMGADSTIVALGVPYARIFLLFTPFFMLNYVISSFVRNDNAPSLAMTATVAGSLSNIVFDYIFMFPMGMGLAGASLATAASPVISIIICSLHFWNKNNTIRFVMKRPSVKMLVEACKLGMSAFIGELSSGVTTTVFNFLILGLAGNTGVAAYGVIANFALIAVSIFNGVSQGAQPLISKYYGKGEIQSVKKLLGLGIKTALVLAILIYAGVFFYTEPLVSLFNSEQSAVLAEYAKTGMRLYFIGFFFAGFNIVGTGFLSATDHPAAAFAASILRGVAAILICSVVLSYLFGMTGVWLAFVTAELITAVVTGIMLLRQIA